MKNLIKYLLISLTINLLAEFSVLADEPKGVFEARIKEIKNSIISSLGIEHKQDNSLPSKIVLLSQEDLPRQPNLRTEHTRTRLGDNKMEDLLLFKDQEGASKASCRIEYTESSYKAKDLLFDLLSLASLPPNYIVLKDGPGDLCITSARYDPTGGKIVPVGKIFLVYGNAFCRVSSNDDSVNGMELAVKLVNGLKQVDK